VDGESAFDGGVAAGGAGMSREVTLRYPFTETAGFGDDGGD
jgi:hypothetical protein